MQNDKKIAIPVVDELMTMHFGHCQKFAIFETKNDQIIHMDLIDPPVHERGMFPVFLAKQGVNVIISGGMGLKALDLFARHKIEVYLGASAETPKSLVEKLLQNKLENGENLCEEDNKLRQCSG
jgi:ATP-binding protein involved in chromosome partitioning